MMLQEKLKQVQDALTKIGPSVYHYWRPKMQAPFIVWAEASEDGCCNADGIKIEQEVRGTVDYYTLLEFDPIFDQIQASLNGLVSTAWELADVQYEEDTGLIHYSWDFWVM